MDFVIQDRTERQWIASLEGKIGSPVPAQYNRFFVKRKTITKAFNGQVLSRDEWIIQIDSLEHLLELRDIAPNKVISIGQIWDHPAVFI